MRIMCGKNLNKKSGHKILKTLRFMVVFQKIMRFRQILPMNQLLPKAVYC